jgi:hypothetical protein
MHPDFSRRPTTISAERELQHTPARVYAFLAHLQNHWRLGGRSLRVCELDADCRGGWIAVAAPLHVRRTARTFLTVAQRPHRLGGVAEVGSRTRADVHWIIEPLPDGARVAIEATIYSTSVIDRSLLLLGGKWWLRRAFRRTLRALVQALDAEHRPAATTIECRRRRGVTRDPALLLSQ